MIIHIGVMDWIRTAGVYFRVTGVGTLENGGIPSADWRTYGSRLTLVMRNPRRGS